MTTEDKLFNLYLLTNPRTTQIGVYQITKKQMAFDLGYSMESVNALLDRFEKHHKLVKYNSETRELAILNWGKYNLNRGGKPVEDCIRKELDGVGDTSLVALVAAKVKTIKFVLFLKNFFMLTIRQRQVDKKKKGKKYEIDFIGNGTTTWGEPNYSVYLQEMDDEFQNIIQIFNRSNHNFSAPNEAVVTRTISTDSTDIIMSVTIDYSKMNKHSYAMNTSGSEGYGYIVDESNYYYTATVLGKVMYLDSHLYVLKLVRIIVYSCRFQIQRT